jgi:hypothetical protein
MFAGEKIFANKETGYSGRSIGGLCYLLSPAAAFISGETLN